MGNTCRMEVNDPETVHLEYFSAHGRAEPLRLLLNYCGVGIVESTVSMPGWVMRKATGNTGEMGVLPIVHYKGK